MDRSVLNRRMFAQGDEVFVPTGQNPYPTGSSEDNYVPLETNTSLDDSTLAVLSKDAIEELQSLGIDATNKTTEQLKNEIDSFIEKEEKRIIFDPTDPLDYASAGLTATGIGASAGLGIKALRTGVKGKQAYEKINRLQQIKNMLNPVKKIPGKVKMSKTGEAIVGASSKGLKLPQSSLYAGQGVNMFNQGDDLLTEAQIIKSELSDLEQDKAKKDEYKIESSEKDLKNKAKKDEDEMMAALNDLNNIYNTSVENASESNKKNQKRFDKSKIFMQEISAALAESGGDMSYGLSTGASRASKRIADEEVATETAFAKMLKDQKEANKLSPSDKNKIAEDYSESVTHLEHMGYIQEKMNELLPMLEGNVTGALGFLNRFGDSVKGFTGGILFDDSYITDATKSKQLVEYIRTQMVQELLRESGRTISNLDRQLINDIVGDITGLGSGEAAVRAALDRINDRIGASIRQYQNQVSFIDYEYGDQLPNLQIFKKGFGQRSQKPLEEDVVVLTEEDTINPGRAGNK